MAGITRDYKSHLEVRFARELAPDKWPALGRSVYEVASRSWAYHGAQCLFLVSHWDSMQPRYRARPKEAEGEVLAPEVGSLFKVLQHGLGVGAMHRTPCVEIRQIGLHRSSLIIVTAQENTPEVEQTIEAKLGAAALQLRHPWFRQAFSRPRTLGIHTPDERLNWMKRTIKDNLATRDRIKQEQARARLAEIDAKSSQGGFPRRLSTTTPAASKEDATMSLGE